MNGDPDSNASDEETYFETLNQKARDDVPENRTLIDLPKTQQPRDVPVVTIYLSGVSIIELKEQCGEQKLQGQV